MHLGRQETDHGQILEYRSDRAFHRGSVVGTRAVKSTDSPIADSRRRRRLTCRKHTESDRAVFIVPVEVRSRTRLSKGQTKVPIGYYARKGRRRIRRTNDNGRCALTGKAEVEDHKPIGAGNPPRRCNEIRGVM